jgi:NitT/TauT family transport system substrate-binding protein
MKVKLPKILLLLTFLRLVFPASHVSAQEPAKLTVGYASLSSSFLPLWMAKEAKLFEKNGLDVQTVLFTAGMATVMALVSGDAPIVHTGGAAIINSTLGGSDAVLILGGIVSLDWWLMSRPEIKTAAQLKGKSVAIASFGATSDFAARYALRKIGLDPEKDVIIVALGSPVTRQAALEANRVQATVHVHPTTFLAQKKGFNVLADLAALGLAYQHAGGATTRRFIRGNFDVVRKYVKSHIEAVHRLKTDRETGVKVLAKYMRGVTDREILEKSYDIAVADNMLPAKQYPTLEGIKLILDTFAEKDPRAKNANPEDFVDMRFVKELDESGFIDNLYKGRKG